MKFESCAKAFNMPFVESSCAWQETKFSDTPDRSRICDDFCIFGQIVLGTMCRSGTVLWGDDGCELMNTAIEYLCDWKAAGYDRTVRDAKDIAAAAVFVCAVSCTIIGLLFFLPVLPFVLRQLRAHILLLTALVISVPCAVWFIFAFGRKR